VDELQKKMNLDTTKRPIKLVGEEVPRISLRLLEVLPIKKNYQKANDQKNLLNLKDQKKN
jgi:hypothetical protein